MDAQAYRQLANLLIATAQRAGRAQLAVFRSDFAIERKADESPVTAADHAAEAIILDDLAKIAPGIPVIAEEAMAAGRMPATGDRFFLVDPLDGTKEFIAKSAEFTINIALIEENEPVFGLVYAPALQALYVTLGPSTAASAMMNADGADVQPEIMTLTEISSRPPEDDGLIVLASRSHMTEATRRYLAELPVKSLRSAGSSLKFCLLAVGEADLYPRFGPTNEWDTAAGHAVLRAAGGEIVTETGEPLRYGKVAEHYRNPSFIAWGWRENVAGDSKTH